MGACRSVSGEPPFASREGYLILVGEKASQEDIRWAKYLYDHLKNRVEDEEVIAYGMTEKTMTPITVQLDPSLTCDFKIERRQSTIGLVARDNEKMLWLQYQLMSALGAKDARITVKDLPPAILSLRDTAGTFSFAYRGIYSQTNQHADIAGLTATDNADGWGLWGHNLSRALGSDAPAGVYATVEGKLNREQFCFSSEETYTRLERYIEDQFGSGEETPVRFVIAPNDNPLVCTCPACLDAGNTAQSATGAVTALITRLAERFPNHLFFTTAYLSTAEPPAKRLPGNVGVVISAMELPLRAIRPEASREKAFAQSLKRWEQLTDKRYIWDYINNFDDYLTPFPVLRILQQRLQFFRSHGVSGVFFNGSGYDYASFDDLKTYVLSSLLVGADLPVEGLVRAFLSRQYPNSKNVLADFYLSLEERAFSARQPLNLYGGIDRSEETFLDVAGFADFYDRLKAEIPTLKGEERKKLHALLTALSFTRLETARRHSDAPYGYARREGSTLLPKPQVKEWLGQLGEHGAFEGMQRYRESGGEIETYIRQWDQYILSGKPLVNLLLGAPLQAISKQDEGYTDLSLLTDGTPGLPDNYHCGWHISSAAALEIGLPVDRAPEARAFRMTFLRDLAHHIFPPRQVELYKDGMLYKTFPVESPGSTAAVSVAAAGGPVDLSGAKELVVKALRPDGTKVQIGIDEITLMP